MKLNVLAISRTLHVCYHLNCSCLFLVNLCQAIVVGFIPIYRSRFMYLYISCHWFLLYVTVDHIRVGWFLIGLGLACTCSVGFVQ